ncbi:MAG: hypothetical protein J0L92_36100, partial [Deltaproteobacteria bacterium]|nr:hypothetical protein [Deltaproteobacteria bacterium]
MPRVVIAGQGLVVVPRAPFEIGRLDSGDLVVVHHDGAVSPKLRLSTAGDAIRLGLGPGTARWEDVVHALDEEPSLRDAPFVLDLDGATTIEWPIHTTAWSADASWPVELTFDDEASDEMLYVQGALDAARVPALSLLVAPGQTLVGTDTLAGAHGPIERVELAYERDGAAWRQWRARVPRSDARVALVTAQAPLVRRARMMAA